MKKLMIGLVAATSLVFGTGCGGDACEDVADALSGLDEKTEDCPSLNQAFEQAGLFDLNDEAIDSCNDDCSSDDKDKLSDAAECFNDLPRCEAGEEEQWAVQAQECVEDFNDATCEG